MTKLIAATTLILMLTSAADAGSGIKIEVPCGIKCPTQLQPQSLFPNGSKAVSYPNGLPVNVVIGGSGPVQDTETPTYESVSRTVTPYGTINSRYRSYNRTIGAR